MAPDLGTLQRCVTVLLNLAAAVVAGAALAGLWLRGATSAWALARRVPLRHAMLAGVVVAMLADAGVLWFEAASMAEVPVADAAGPAWAMLTATHFGIAWAVGMLALAAAAVAAIPKRQHGVRAALPALAALAVFWATRSIASHATADGDLSLRVAADWLHLALASAWVGTVVVAGMLVLAPRANLAPDDRRERAAWVASLSASATVAVGGIFVTGVYGAWRTLGAWSALLGNPYGNTLSAKIVLVGVAALLGGFNRWVVMPHWPGAETAGEPAPDNGRARFRRVLWIEALVLLAVLVLAAWLVSTSPPGDAVESAQTWQRRRDTPV